MNQELEIKRDVTPNIMLQMAIERNADIDKLEKLMDLQERWEAKQAKMDFVNALAKFREDCPDIEKTKQGHNCKYAPLGDVIRAITPAMANNGLSHSWTQKQENGSLTVDCVVTHISGHSERTSLTAPPDNSGGKNSIQALGSTNSYLQRYTLFAILGLASKDDDGKASGSGYITNEQEAELNLLFGKLPLDAQEAFLKWLKIEDISDIVASQYNQAKNAINSKIKKLEL